jgi:hypothetical protein
MQTLNLPIELIDRLLNYLVNRPFIESAGFIQAIQQVSQEQNQPKSEEGKKDAKANKA